MRLFLMKKKAKETISSTKLILKHRNFNKYLNYCRKLLRKLQVNFNIKCILRDIEALVIAEEISNKKKEK